MKIKKLIQELQQLEKIGTTKVLIRIEGPEGNADLKINYVGVCSTNAHEVLIHVLLPYDEEWW